MCQCKHGHPDHRDPQLALSAPQHLCREPDCPAGLLGEPVHGLRGTAAAGAAAAAGGAAGRSPVRGAGDARAVGHGAQAGPGQRPAVLQPAPQHGWHHPARHPQVAGLCLRLQRLALP